MTALEIITQARERLGDLKEQRWTNDRLLTIVSQGQVDICVESGYLRREIIVPLTLGENIYQLPRDCYTIKRVEYDDVVLPLHTRSDQDVPRALTADYTAYKSNLNMDKLEIQPAPDELETTVAYIAGDILEDTFVINPLYGVVTLTSNPVIAIDPLYGVAVDADITLDLTKPSTGYGEIAGSNKDTPTVEYPNSVYGVTTGFEYDSSLGRYGFISAVNGHKVSGTYGISTSVADIRDTFKVYYVAIPAKLQFVNTILILPTMWEEMLMRYVVGTALQDDNDANNLARGEAELQKYAAKLATIKDLSSKDFSGGTSDKFATNFRRI